MGHVFSKTTHKHVVDNKSIQGRKHKSVSIHGKLVMKSMNNEVNCVHPGNQPNRQRLYPVSEMIMNMVMVFSDLANLSS